MSHIFSARIPASIATLTYPGAGQRKWKRITNGDRKNRKKIYIETQTHYAM